jgi:uncharacterized protein involved in propanediol utilization
MSAPMSLAGSIMAPGSAEAEALVEGQIQGNAVHGVGSGIGSGHYGELLQGEVRDDCGRLRRCLVTLPCSLLRSEAQFTVAMGAVQVQPASKVKAKRAAELTLEHFNLQGMGGMLRVQSNIAEGKGNGSSSADCVAAARAVASALGCNLPPEDLAQLIVAAESASDSVMFESPVLFAHREGVVLEYYGSRLPALEVIGIDAEPERSIETLEYPPASYSSSEHELFRLLIDVLRQAIHCQDPRLLSEVANLSALINQRFLPNALFQELHAICKETGGLGISVAHSGTVICILLHPSDPALNKKIEQFHRRLTASGIESMQRFRTL